MALRRDAKKTYQENRDYYDGLHWKTWIGPRIPLTEPGAAELMAEVERVFQSVNFVRECCDRHVNALIGRFPMWYLKAEGGDRLQTRDDDGNPIEGTPAQAEQELQRWIDAVLQRSDAGVTDQGDPFLKSITDLAVCGYGALRLWQPARFDNAPDPIDRIHLHAPNPGSVVEDRGDDEFLDKLTYSYGSGQREEMTLEGDTLTILTAASPEPVELDTGGRWTISQMRSPSLLTPQIKKNQDAVNHALTMMLRNGEQAGFLERIFLNAELPGEWVDDSTAVGGRRFVPHDLERGPGRDTYLYGIPTGDADNPGYATPAVQIREASDPDTFLKQVEAWKALIYHAFGQGHMLASDDGGISGVSRIQLRADFEILLRRQKRVIEAAIANILNVVLKILGYQGMEVVVQLQISTGKLSPEERAAVIAEYDKGLLSKATTMAILGSVEDIDAELALMAEEEAEASTVPRPDPANLDPTV